MIQLAKLEAAAVYIVKDALGRKELLFLCSCP